jgi:tetratricopeptide (TPR) repeat protein
VDSTDADLLFARFTYLFTKAQTSSVVVKDQKKYLGMEPLFSLKDSLGKDVFYFQEVVFDDELYGQAVKAAEKAVSAWPDRLDFRLMKANAYIAYEKESPDMALAYLQELVKENAVRKSPWDYNGVEADDEFFEEVMQEYCFSFYTIGSPVSQEAFHTLSRQLCELYPDNMVFLNNIGSYHLLKGDYKTALKYYDKVLKKHPDDYTAIKNSILAARKQKNQKLEKKYLEMMVKYGPENERLQAQGRLAVLKK